ncbi:MAG: sensor histidine kinase [Bryobacterales bacterium]|nr:sensor histidine kinase [Bryobacterales bacterium]
MRDLISRSRLSGTFVLHAGYAILLALLAFGAYEVLRLVSTNSAVRITAYEAYLDQEEVLATLRRSVWSGSNSARDFYLSRDAERLSRFESQIRDIRADTLEALARLRELDPHRTAQLNVEARVTGYVQGLSLLTPGGAEPGQRLRDLLPLRMGALSALEDFTRLAQQDVRTVLDQVARQRSRTARNLLLVLSVILVIGALVAWRTLRYANRWEQDRFRHHIETAEAKAELERLSANLLDVQEEERRRLSRELHDEVGQTLTALRMEISHSAAAVHEPEPRVRLDRARQLADRCVNMVRNISVMLRPALLDDLGLAAALQWQVEELARRSGIQASFSFNDSGEELSDRVKTCIYRIAQEALNNCEKYAQAAHVTVKLVREAGNLTLTVEDDGVGFNLNGHAMPVRGTGILGIRERVSQLNGSLTLDTGMGQGTRLTVAIPLDPAVVRPEPAGVTAR